MPAPYGFNLSDGCLKCKFRRDGFFCHTSAAELKDFYAITSISAYPAGAVLFLEQQPPRGVFQICQGEVKLCLSSKQGKTLTLKVAGPGDVLGLEAVLSGAPYEATAESLRPCQLAFVSSRDFRSYLHKHPAAFRRAARHLALQYKAACEQLSAIGLGASVVDRTVRFLLDWSAQANVPGNGNRSALPLNHEQIGERIGASRESVTRTLSMLRKRGLIESRRSTLIIPDRAALAAFHLRRPGPDGDGPQLVRSVPAALRQRSPDMRQTQREQYGIRSKRAGTCG